MTTRTGDALVAQLNAMRNRARRVLAIRYCVVAAAPALVAGYALAVASAAGAAQTLTILTLSLATGLGLAVGAAVRRAPTLSGTAAIVDRRQRLESRATTGLQFAAHDDPVSLLVMRDATARLAGCEPAAVFPIELPERWPWILGGAAAASLLVALTLGGVAPSQPADGSGGGAAAGSAQARSSNDSPRAVSSLQTATPPVERQGPSSAPRGVQPSNDVPATSRGASATPRRAGDERDPTSAPSRGTSPAAHVNRAPVDVSIPSTSSGASSGGPASAGLSSGATGAAGSARAGAGGAGAATARNLVKGAGGVKGGTLTSPGPDARLSATAPMMPNSARYRAEWERGQAAIERERVPPALRKYVLDYFAAIRPRQP